MFVGFFYFQNSEAEQERRANAALLAQLLEEQQDNLDKAKSLLKKIYPDL